MKTFTGILFAICPILSFGQFPEPVNFTFSYQYYMIDQSGECAGQWVYGPTYCSHFSWNAPDTNATNSTLAHYNLYYYSWGSQDTVVLTSTTDLQFDMEIGIIGEIWVTAVYSDPDGESEPSNIIINDDLPISVNEYDLQNEPDIFYDNQNQEIIIKNRNKVSRINIYNCNGELMISTKTIRSKINIEHFTAGLFIVELILADQDVIRHKIIK